MQGLGHVWEKTLLLTAGTAEDSRNLFLPLGGNKRTEKKIDLDGDGSSILPCIDSNP